MPSANAILATYAVNTGDFSDVSTPTVFTYTVLNTYWSSQPLSFRIVKSARCAHGLSFQNLTVCAATDGSPCAAQVADSCPGPAPSPPPSPASVCANVGACCLYEPCCDGSTCADFGQYKLCVNHLCAPSPATTPAPTYSSVTAFVSTVFDLDLSFWYLLFLFLEL